MWKTRLNILTTRSSGDSVCSRCTGIRRRATVRACWSICRWTRRASRRWRGWTNINHKESDGWQCAIFGYSRPALLDGSLTLRERGRESTVGKSCMLIYDFSTHCAPDTPSALCHSWRRERTGGGQSPPPPVPPGSGQQNRHCVVPSTYPCRLRVGPRQRPCKTRPLSPHPCGLPGTSQRC